MATSQRAHRRVRTPGLLIGIGLGGFIDGIVLHQILRWHHMLSSEGSFPLSTVDGLDANTLADGIFHAAMWVVLAVGLWALWRTFHTGAPVAGVELVGWMLVGWAGFNLVEGVVDHLILGIHHVREGADELAWDLGFLALSVAVLILGLAAVRAGRRRVPLERDSGTQPT